MWFLLAVLVFGCANAMPQGSETVHRRRMAGDVSPYIVGGEMVTGDQANYQVGLADRSSSGAYYVFCGATWLNNGDVDNVRIVTAAHCVNGLRTPAAIARIRVYFGMLNSTSMASTTFSYYNITNIKVHENYNSRTLTNDIAVIRINGLKWADVEQETRYPGGRKPVPVPLANQTYDHDERALVSGWGTLTSGGQGATYLKIVDKPVLSLDACKATSIPDTELDATMMCAGETNKDACQGDSGGPLVIVRNNVRYLAGAVSWGYGCGAAGYPGVYADTFALRNWILVEAAKLQ